MVNFILPWRFSVTISGARSFAGKANLAAQHIILFLLGILVVFSFLVELQCARRKKRKHYIKIAIRKWWNAY